MQQNPKSEQVLTSYNCDHFIKKYSVIPENLWCIENHTAPDGTHCAFGHCSPNGYPTFEYSSLREVFKAISVTIIKESKANSYKVGDASTGSSAVTAINNGHCKEYQQPTPKQRILAALYDIKAMTEPQVEIQLAKIEPKTITKYVTVKLSSSILDMEVLLS
jgi:hypothetical protein